MKTAPSEKALYRAEAASVVLRLEQRLFMQNKIPCLVALLVGSAMLTGCANVEKKFGRGIANTVELVRLGEMRRTIEQTTLFEDPDIGYTKGFIRGLNRSLARTGVGLYEIVTAPIPPYEPVFTDYLTPDPVYPDNFKPDVVEDSMFATDTNLGFSGGDVLPVIPGNRFRIFDTH